MKIFVIDLTYIDLFIDIEVKKSFNDKQEALNWIDKNRYKLADIVKLLIISKDGVKFEELENESVRNKNK